MRPSRSRAATQYYFADNQHLPAPQGRDESTNTEMVAMVPSWYCVCCLRDCHGPSGRQTWVRDIRRLDSFHSRFDRVHRLLGYWNYSFWEVGLVLKELKLEAAGGPSVAHLSGCVTDGRPLQRPRKGRFL
jgi:hypothetical protein